MLGGTEQGGVDGVHQPVVDVAGGAAQHGQDDCGDDQPDDGVGRRPAGGDAGGPDDDSKRGQAVGERVGRVVDGVSEQRNRG